MSDTCECNPHFTCRRCLVLAANRIPVHVVFNVSNPPADPRDPCPTCKGDGGSRETGPCYRCNGKGFIESPPEPEETY